MSEENRTQTPGVDIKKVRSNNDSDSGSRVSSRASSFASGQSPFRSASVRLGSPVTTNAALFHAAASGLNDGNDNDDAVDDEEFEEDNGDGNSDAFHRAMSFATNTPLNESGAVSIRSVDIDNPDPEVVKVVGRHLVRDPDNAGEPSNAVDEGLDEFASLRLQGGDITRQLYNWQREHEEETGTVKRGRSRSFTLPRPVPKGPSDEPLDIKNIKAPGGFRRNFLVKKAQEQDPENLQTAPPTFLTRNFIEFLSIYGHFAGEELEEEEYETEEAEEDEAGPADERTALIRRPSRPKLRRKPTHTGKGNATITKTVLLIIKSFVGTGVLFLPRGFYNGGLLFSSLLLVTVSCVSTWCFHLLITAKDAVGVNSFGDIGGALYGPKMRHLILSSIVISQIGFAAAYIVFTSENLRALVLSLTNHATDMSIESLILLQLILFMPLSMIRDIAKLSGTALVADLFILFGLLVLYFWDVRTIVTEGVADVVMFNADKFTLFIGTAIFTFEGVGLIIPIQESMRRPEKFMTVCGMVMIFITIVLVSMGMLGYMAFGSNVQTVVILNLPQDSHTVNGLQLLYSLAIVLSTPLQLFPAIRIIENGLFVRSGKYSNKIKWEKNFVRFVLVMLTAAVAWIGADDLDKFVSLTGAFACIPLVYIYPPMLHLKSVARSPLARAGDIVLIAVGAVAMVYTTSRTLASWVS
uniref:ARAD1D35376p n=1 Tax=Blastobotrys adeninivorans TaxID=409370 RepID=A0A060TCD4_BLAAD